MKCITLRGKSVVEGVAEGEALVTRGAIQFFGTVEYRTGVITAPLDHELRGVSISGKILVCDSEVGSTAEPFGFYLLKKAGMAPAAIVVKSRGTMPVICSLVTNTPFVFDLDSDPLEHINSGDQVRVDGNRGIVEVIKGEGPGSKT